MVNLKNLRRACLTPEKSLLKGKRWRFIDNKSSILGVAHVDSVQDKQIFVSEAKIGKNKAFFSPVLDDRLGVYTMLYHLPSIGITPDVLLTTDEETCNSSANEVQVNKKYNWVFMFDRGYNDVVMYHYHNGKAIEELKEAGWAVGVGSYSCICDLDVKCCGFNFGTAYKNYHDYEAFFYESEYLNRISKFKKFYDKNKDTYFENVGCGKGSYGYGGYSRYSGYAGHGTSEKDSYKYNGWEDYTKRYGFGEADVVQMCELCQEHRAINGDVVCWNCANLNYSNQSEYRGY